MSRDLGKLLSASRSDESAQRNKSISFVSGLLTLVLFGVGPKVKYDKWVGSLGFRFLHVLL